MAHTRKDTLTAPVEWARHLRHFGKRIQAKKERKAARREIEREKKDIIPATFPPENR